MIEQINPHLKTPEELETDFQYTIKNPGEIKRISNNAPDPLSPEKDLIQQNSMFTVSDSQKPFENKARKYSGSMKTLFVLKNRFIF